MGLDTYAVEPKRDDEGLYPHAPAAHFAEVGSLCGGLLSGNGNDGSFRGKVYSHIIEEITSQSLYQEFIAPDVVAGMSDALDRATDVDGDDIAADELAALRQFFAVCRDHGYGLVGWW